MIIEHYDYNVGWENTKPGWYECTVRAKHLDKYNEIIKWLENYLRTEQDALQYLVEN